MLGGQYYPLIPDYEETSYSDYEYSNYKNPAIAVSKAGSQMKRAQGPFINPRFECRMLARLINKPCSQDLILRCGGRGDGSAFIPPPTSHSWKG
jgi:hypothetical protein